MLKEFTLASILAASLAFPARAEDKIKNYLNEKIESYEKNNQDAEAARTEYLVKEIKKFEQGYNRELSNELYNRNHSYHWTTKQKISFLSSSLLAAMDCYQTANIPNDKEDGYYTIKFYENPLIGSLFGEKPSDGEMLLWYAASTTAWYFTCDLVPKYLTSKFLPEKYNKYTRDLMLALGNIYYLHYVINNEKVTGGIIFKF